MSVFLPSVQEQLASARESSSSGYVCTHVDTCLGTYLNDHHNRDNELLLGVFVDGNSTYGDIKLALVEEFNQIGYELGENKPGYDHDKARAAIDEAFSHIPRSEMSHIHFDETLDIMSEADLAAADGDDYCQAWFVISWDPEEGEEASD